jgi:hypothetical protein
MVFSMLEMKRKSLIFNDAAALEEFLRGTKALMMTPEV